MFRTLILTICLSSFAGPLWAQNIPTQPAPQKGQSSLESIYFNLGTHTEFFNNTQIDDSGVMRRFDTSAPTLGVGATIPLEHSELRFIPEFNWVLPRNSGSSRVIKNLMMFRADLGYDPYKWLRLRAGTSIMWQNMHGRGGKAVLNNGNETATFYYPDENRSSFNNTLDHSAELRYEEWALRLQTYIYSAFREDRRQVSYTLFISYYSDQ